MVAFDLTSRLAFTFSTVGLCALSSRIYRIYAISTTAYYYWNYFLPFLQDLALLLIIVDGSVALYATRQYNGSNKDSDNDNDRAGRQYR